MPVFSLQPPDCLTGLPETSGGRTPYQYNPLSGPGSIRLLILEPANFDDIISCSLSSVLLTACPPYEALSYAWGTSEKSHVVFHGKERIPVTENLHAALKQFRFPDEPRTLWVDAICINQQDVPERNQQVQIMGTIFKNAECVLVWLGEGMDGYEEVFELIESFNGNTETEVFGVNLLEMNYLTNIAASIILRESLLKALSSFFERSWFRRVWVIQEVAVASNIQVACGPRACQWAAISRLAFYLDNNGLSGFFGGYKSIKSMKSMTVIRRMVNDDGIQADLLGVLYLLSYTENFECTVPHDKVFALLGLTSLVSAAGITVDYGLPCEKIFTDLATWHILQPKFTFLVLSSVEYHPEVTRTTLPSWVPDWFLKPKVALVNRLQTVGKYTTAADSVAEVSVSSHQILTITGFIFDKIERMASKTFFTVDSDYQQDSFQRLKATNQFTLGLINECYQIATDYRPYPTGEEGLSAFARALVCNVAKQGNKNAEAISQFYVQGYLGYMELLEVQHEEFETGTRRHDERLEDLLKTARQYESNLGVTALNRRFCATSKRYLGWIPASASTNDIICIFKGGPVPYVLRPVDDDHYILIGECCVHGIMDGEAMNMGLTEQKFNIQ